MSSGKKIFFLFLLLVLLIILCVTTHIESVHKNINTEELQKVDFSPYKIEEKTPQGEIVVNKEVEKKDFEEQETEQEEVKIKEEKTNTQSNETEKISSKEPQLNENKNQDEILEDEIIEDGQPLISTDKRYKRTKDEKAIEDMSINTQLLQIRIRDYVTKYPVTFEASSNKITKKSLNTIKTIIKILKNYPNIKIEIAGHTDAAGSKKYNLNVSINRAVAVKKKMIDYGFDKDRIKARGYGESIPLVENSPKGFSRVNRRVEFNIVEE